MVTVVSQHQMALWNSINVQGVGRSHGKDGLDFPGSEGTVE